MHTSCRCLIWCGIITTLDIIIRYQFWYRCLLFEGSPFLFRVYTQPGFVRHLCWRFLNPKITLLYPGFCALPIPSIKKGLPPRCARNNTSRPKPLQPQATIMGCIPNSKKKKARHPGAGGTPAEAANPKNGGYEYGVLLRIPNSTRMPHSRCQCQPA